MTLRKTLPVAAYDVTAVSKGPVTLTVGSPPVTCASVPFNIWES